jgi:hypothetical protein
MKVSSPLMRDDRRQDLIAGVEGTGLVEQRREVVEAVVGDLAELLRVAIQLGGHGRTCVSQGSEASGRTPDVPHPPRRVDRSPGTVQAGSAPTLSAMGALRSFWSKQQKTPGARSMPVYAATYVSRHGVDHP